MYENKQNHVAAVSVAVAEPSGKPADELVDTQGAPAKVTERPPNSSVKRSRWSLRRKLLPAVAVAVVLALFGGALVSLTPDTVQNSIEAAAEIVDETVGVEVNVFEDDAASAGNWHWGTYRFNYWETREIARWTPWGCGSSCWAAGLITGLGRFSPAGWMFFPIMWSYKAQAQNALNQGRCLNVAWWGGSWVGACGR